MRFKSRYKYWHVLVGLFSIGLLYTIIHFLSSIGSSPETVKEVAEPKYIPNKSHFAPLHMFFYLSVFFYFTLNYFYNFIAARKRLLSYLKLIVIIVLIETVY